MIHKKTVIHQRSIYIAATIQRRCKSASFCNMKAAVVLLLLIVACVLFEESEQFGWRRCGWRRGWRRRCWRRRTTTTTTTTTTRPSTNATQAFLPIAVPPISTSGRKRREIIDDMDDTLPPIII
ncbi:uncharacterized protein LOC116847614 [Odontomachus brunneus]|uniref:uncharacterized protein LOC116847614 n=1 Tax=Odontomachus brunneus TaxID=486640 RepID=UPI0013F2024F|nr:uncharacterized protein LOC116847614 [Odontomachus brunneus]